MQMGCLCTQRAMLLGRKRTLHATNVRKSTMVKETIEKKKWLAPTVIVHGKIEEITRQIKNKEFGPDDDVLISNQAILHDACGL